MPALDTEITIGDLARRSGVATSALRFYESRGLISSARTNGGQRRFARPTLRRVAFIQAAQRVGLSLDEIAIALRTLPERRTPTKADWAVLSRSWKALLRSRIEELETLQTRLTSCIGDRKSTRLNSSHSQISYAVFCLKKKNVQQITTV